MTILTSYTAATYKAQIRGSLSLGFRKLYTASSTESDERAAKNVVLKYYGYASSQTVREVTDAQEIRELIGDFFKSPQRKQVFRIWTFDPKAR